MDTKERLLLDFRTAMNGAGFTYEQIMSMSNVLICELSKYDVQPLEKSLQLNDDRNGAMIRGFIATLLTEGKSRKTTLVYASALKRFAQDCQHSLAEVSTYDVRLWLAKLEQSVSLRTCENYRAYLSSFYQWATNEEIIQRNPMGKIKPIKHTIEVKLPFSAVDVDRLRSACHNVRDRAVLELLLSCGARVSELCAMDVGDIDFNSRRILIREGKGNKQRTVYMSDVCKSYLESYLVKRDTNDNFLFGTRMRQRITAACVRKFLNALGETAGVTNVHPHRCRRTFATELARRGMPVQEIQRLMGHSDINTTMGYIKLDDTSVEFSYKKCG